MLGRARGRPRHPDLLTPSEWAVLALVARGRTNEQIAAEQGISLSTVKFHVSAILGKTQSEDRQAASRWYGQRTLRTPLVALLARPWRWGAKAAPAFGAAVIAVALTGITVLGIAVACADTRDDADSSGMAVRFTPPAEGFVYMERILSPPAFRIAVFDTARMTDVASFELPTVEPALCDCPGTPQAAVADDRVIVNHADRVISYALDGSDERTLREAPRGGTITGMDVSPDDATLAVTELTGDPCPATARHEHEPRRQGPAANCLPFEDFGRVVLIDLASGATLHEIPQSAPGLDELFGRLQRVSWFGDSSALAVQAEGGDNEAQVPAGTAIVGVDGSIRLSPINVNVYDLSQPNGRYMFTAQTSEGVCGGRIEAAIYDLQTNSIAATARDESRVVTNAVWSPDGGELLYATSAAQPSLPCEIDENDMPQWAVLHVDGSPAESGVDPFAVVDRWYGDRLITYTCDRDRVVWTPCTGLGLVIDVAFGGQTVASTLEFQVLGWID